jgi:uncharacterized protein (TIGR00369 family)
MSQATDEPAHAHRNLDRWLGNGGMPLIDQLGASFNSYGVDGEDLGWVEGSFTPTELCCNPSGVVQAGVHAVLHDASISLAINAALARGERARATLELKVETMRPALSGTHYRLRGEVVRMARQIAFGEATIRDRDGDLVSRSTATFLLERAERPTG